MLNEIRTNLFNVARHYVKSLNIGITDTTLKDRLEQNPFYPSLFSLASVFDRFSISNESYQIQEKDLKQFESPFITYWTGPKGVVDFILVTKIQDNTVSYISNSDRVHKVAKDEF